MALSKCDNPLWDFAINLLRTLRFDIPIVLYTAAVRGLLAAMVKILTPREAFGIDFD